MNTKKLFDKMFEDMPSGISLTAFGEIVSAIVGIALAVLIMIILSWSERATAGDVVAGVTVKAQHFRGDHWEEWNPGVTIENRLRTPAGNTFTTGAGIVRDSIGNWSPAIAGGMLFDVTGNFRVGGSLILLYRHRNLDGSREGYILAPLPVAEYWFDDVAVSALFIPRRTDLPRDSASVLFSIKYRFN